MCLRKPNDRQLLDWLRSVDRELLVVATKVDKLSGNERTRNLAALKRELEVDEISCRSRPRPDSGIEELWRADWGGRE